MPHPAAKSLNSLLSKLQKDRAHHVAAIEEIDAVFAKLSGGGRPAGAGRAVGRRPRGGRSGSRIQGVKAALLATLSSKPQSPMDLAKAVSKKLGAKVSIATQLQTLKVEKKAKAVERGRWVRA